MHVSTTRPARRGGTAGRDEITTARAYGGSVLVEQHTPRQVLTPDEARELADELLAAAKTADKVAASAVRLPAPETDHADD